MSRGWSGVLLLALASAPSACAQSIVATLSPGAASGSLDQSVTAPSRHGVRVVMVLPPQGTERDQQKVPEISSLEKELLRHGIRVISAGLTGRVAIETRSSESGSQATHLSQLERALVLAKKSNADALLQVERLDWVPESRRYVYRPPATHFDPATEADWASTPPGQRYAIIGPTVHIEGKLIDVESREVMVAIDLSQATTHLVPPEVTKTFTWISGQGFSASEYGDGTMSTESPEYRRRAEDSLMSALATRIAGSPEDAPPPVAQEPPPPAVAPTPAPVPEPDPVPPPAPPPQRN